MADKDKEKVMIKIMERPGNPPTYKAYIEVGEFALQVGEFGKKNGYRSFVAVSGETAKLTAERALDRLFFANDLNVIKKLLERTKNKIGET